MISATLITRKCCKALCQKHMACRQSENSSQMRRPHPDEADSSQAGGEGDNAAEEAQDAHYHPRPAHGCIGDLPRIRAGLVLKPRASQ